MNKSPESTQRAPAADVLSPPYYAAMQGWVHQLQRAPHRVLHVELRAFSQFQCSQCGDCCKLPWNIHISQGYYEQWYEVMAQDASGRFAEPFVRNPEADNPNHFATVKRDPDTGFCIFLEDDDSCYIHKNYGEEALSIPCSTFPRAHKQLGHQYSANYVLNSCLDVPALLREHTELCVRLDPVDSAFFIQRESGEHFGRYENYLWLGLAFDVLAAEYPLTTLGRWRCLIPKLEEIQMRGIYRIQEQDLNRIYLDVQNALKHADFYLPPLNLLQRALHWSQNILRYHPGCHRWLQGMIRSQHEIPALSPEEQRLLDEYILLYMRHRLLALPYTDAFMGELNFWQQMFFLSLQVLSLQWLALYYRFRAVRPLSAEHIQRAMSTVGKLYEQRGDLRDEAGLARLSPEQCFDGLYTMLSLDFAAPYSYRNLLQQP